MAVPWSIVTAAPIFEIVRFAVANSQRLTTAFGRRRLMLREHPVIVSKLRGRRSDPCICPGAVRGVRSRLGVRKRLIQRVDPPAAHEILGRRSILTARSLQHELTDATDFKLEYCVSNVRYANWQTLTNWAAM